MKRPTPRTRWLLVLLALLLIYHYGWGSPFFATYAYSSKSPDGAYRLDVYYESRPFFTMPGDGGRKGSHVVLRNRWGWKVAASEKPCEVFTDDLYGPDHIVWEASAVRYAPARSINLVTRKCEY